MTNAMIILMESVKLMEQGVIGTTGRTFTVMQDDGTEKVLCEPEAIHTFSHWKHMGFSVKKGEHAVAKFPIWSGTEKTVRDEDGNETGEKVTKLYMRNAFFFTAAQVEPLKETSEKGRKRSSRGRRGTDGRQVAVTVRGGDGAYGSWLIDA